MSEQDPEAGIGGLYASDVTSDVRDAELATLRAENERLTREMRDVEEAESRCCDEDFGFEEVIKSLRADVSRLQGELAEARKRIIHLEVREQSLEENCLSGQNAHSALARQYRNELNRAEAAESRESALRASLKTLAERMRTVPPRSLIVSAWAGELALLAAPPAREEGKK